MENYDLLVECLLNCSDKAVDPTLNHLVDYNYRFIDDDEMDYEYRQS